MRQPTSGLDSTSTIIVLDVLRQVSTYPAQRIVDSQIAQVADGGCAVVFSIHQPSLKVCTCSAGLSVCCDLRFPQAFLKFDQILLMSRSAGREYGGQQLFLGSPAEAVRYFRSMAATDHTQIFPDELSEQLTNAGCQSAHL